MPIHLIRSIYWKYRSPPSRLGGVMAEAPLSETAANKLRRIYARRKKENYDHGCRPSRWRQPELADRGTARTGGLRRLSALRKDGALQPGENSRACGACQGLSGTRSFGVQQPPDHHLHASKPFYRPLPN